MKKERLTLSERCKQAKQTTIRELLDWLGFQPEKNDKGELWYRSPLRQEATASFKLTRDGRAWFDHGSGDGGNILDFAMAYFRTDLRGAVEELEKLRGGEAAPPVTRQPSLSIKKAAPKDEEFHILRLQPIASRALTHYLETRAIPLTVAADYLQELYYERAGKLYFALAFVSDSGGYELRNPYFKGAHGSKDITTIRQESAAGGRVSVFEGFMDFLSAIVLAGRAPESTVIVMNSVAMKDRVVEAIQKLNPGHVDLYLDHDEAGRNLTEELRQSLTGCAITDRSSLYEGYKDMNDWLIARIKANQTVTPVRERC